MIAVVIVGILAGIVLLGGGNTLEGFGSDLQKSGERIHNVTHHRDEAK